MAELKLFRRSERAVIGNWRDILVTIWRTDVDVDDVKRAEAAQDELISECGTYGTFAVAEKGALRISPEARKEAARVTEEGKGACCAVAMVIAVDGFTGAAVRAAVTAVHILSRSRVPQRSFDRAGPAAAWMFEKLRRDTAELDAFIALVERARTDRA
jgi:hypothetical protein